MHHKRGRDYQAANVGWLWKQRHVYTGGDSDTNFTGTKEINKYGDSQAVGLVTDRYRFTWALIPRLNLPNGRLITYSLGSSANRNGKDATLQTAGTTITAHSSLGLASSARSNVVGWGRNSTDQTADTHQNFTLNLSGTQTTFNDSAEVVAVRL